MDGNWIAIEDCDEGSCPEDGRYLVVVTADWTPPRAIIFATFHHKHGWWFDDPFSNWEITHYQPVPKLPRAI